jgi:uncharacterized membrane protein (DUF4010 family)
LDQSTQLLFQQLGISLVLGLLVGLQRQRTEPVLAGLRTFPLITVLGTIAMWVDRTVGASGSVVAAGFLSLAALIIVANWHHLQVGSVDLGITTELAILVMFALGSYIAIGPAVVAIAVGAGVAVLLQFKPELHGIAARLGDDDLRAIMTFALITCIVLPMLPNRSYNLPVPLNVLNPFEIWLMVVLMVGISLGGYLIYKFFGRNAGILLGGILGGAISSTATTLTYAKRTRTDPHGSRSATIVIAIASVVVYVRVLAEILIVAPTFLKDVAAPISAMMASSTMAIVILWFFVRREPERMPEQKNPAELKSATVFGILYAGVLMALSAAKAYVGKRGLYAIAAVSGLTDMDAITLSTARMFQTGTAQGGISASDGWRLIIIATMSNLCFKAGIAALAGNRKLIWPVLLAFTLPFVTGGFLLLASSEAFSPFR